MAATRFPLIPPGIYRLQVDAKGFKPFIVEKVEVRITEYSVANADLSVQGGAQTVTVTSESPLVQTESSARGTVIDENEVGNLPLPTRNFQQLLGLSTGTSGSLANSSDLGRGDTAIYVNGQRALSNNVVINGVDVNSIGTGSMPNLAVPSIDSIQEFIVQTSLYDASHRPQRGRRGSRCHEVRHEQLPWRCVRVRAQYQSWMPTISSSTRKCGYPAAHLQPQPIWRSLWADRW